MRFIVALLHLQPHLDYLLFLLGYLVLHFDNHQSHLQSVKYKVKLIKELNYLCYVGSKPHLWFGLQ